MKIRLTIFFIILFFVPVISNNVLFECGGATIRKAKEIKTPNAIEIKTKNDCMIIVISPSGEIIIAYHEKRRER